MSIILNHTDFDTQNTDILLRKMRIISSKAEFTNIS